MRFFWSSPSYVRLAVADHMNPKHRTEKALDWMLMRINEPRMAPFGKMLKERRVIMKWGGNSASRSVPPV